MCEATFGDVRGKNHHMYNEHQLDAFHQKCKFSFFLTYFITVSILNFA